MRTSSIVDRLLWKEFRQCWVILLLGLALPPIGAEMVRLHWMFWSINPITFFSVLLIVAVVIWTATMTPGRGRSFSYATMHFSIHPAWEAITSLALRSFVVGLIGFCASYWHANHPITFLEEQPMGFGLYFVTTYLITYICSVALSPMAGIILGVAGAGMSIGIVESMASKVGGDHGLGYTFWTMLITVGLLLAFSFFTFPIRVPIRVRRVGAITLLILALCWQPLVMKLMDRSGARYKGDISSYSISERRSEDGSLFVEVGLIRPACKQDRVQFKDFRLQRACALDTTPITFPIGFIGRDVVVLAQRHSGDRHLALLEWNTHTNALKQIVLIPTRPRPMFTSTTTDSINLLILMKFCKVSPDGRYAILFLPSKYCNELNLCDLWLVDLARHTARLARPAFGQAAFINISWLHDSAILYGMADPFTVNLATGKTRPLSLPRPRYRSSFPQPRGVKS